MPRLAANLSLLFTELPLLERFDAAAAAGFQAVEHQWPYEQPARALAQRLEGAGLQQVLFNSPSGDTAAGERGLAALPGRQDEFRRGVQTALEYAEVLRCTRVHVMAGVPGPDVDPGHARDTLLENLLAALDAARGSGVTLLLEPLNAHDAPGYFLGTLAQAQDVVDELGDAGLALQLDWYHAARRGEDVVEATRRHLPSTGHLQVAGFPGRHEPDVGDLDHLALFTLVDELGYTGWVGCEYQPLTTTEAGLGWLPWRSSTPPRGGQATR